jgi:antitoxin ParD1/3/4
MDVRLSPDLEDIVREKVATGHYRDESDVVAEALRLLDRVEQQGSVADAALAVAVQRGVEDYEAGRYTVINNLEELEAFFEES